MRASCMPFFFHAENVGTQCAFARAALVLSADAPLAVCCARVRCPPQKAARNSAWFRDARAAAHGEPTHIAQPATVQHAPRGTMFFSQVVMRRRRRPRARAESPAPTAGDPLTVAHSPG